MNSLLVSVVVQLYIWLFVKKRNQTLQSQSTYKDKMERGKLIHARAAPPPSHVETCKLLFRHTPN